MPSFDIVSEADEHEVTNAVEQTKRELQQRYDFRGTGAELDRKENQFVFSANSEDRVKAAYDVLVDKMVKRKVSLKFLDKKDAEPAGGQAWKLSVNLRKGIDKENAKKLVKMIKDDKSFNKVTPSIQGESVRVTGKKRDDLQNVMGMLREKKDFPLALEFDNFRD